MSEDHNNVSRRDALKGLAVLGTSLPVLNQQAFGQGQSHAGHGQAEAKSAGKKTAFKPKFFKPEQLALVGTISELIIPTDDNSPGAKAAEVPEFIDLMLSESPEETKKLWTDGLAAVDKLSQDRHQVAFNKATAEQQVAILKEISKNEMKPQSLEERFFKAIKNLTIDGYYTSKIGIHQELKYKGNTYLKEFKGCTHPEHQS
ncbi:MAG TPA: gluconate 2-dehydrogenase subunit 3 family protein [Blastocatellia bacterium]|nr:gluconate 2-dehydrogenase subunit 3 family protein [Blastocatellia bacterium]